MTDGFAACAGETFVAVVFQIECRSFSDLLIKSISSASKLRQWQLWRTEICAAKIRKFSRISEKSGASSKDLKNPRYRIVLVNDLLQIGSSPALPSSSISASSFDLNNYKEKGGFNRFQWDFPLAEVSRQLPDPETLAFNQCDVGVVSEAIQ